jgi:hypothetical protein
MSHQISLSAGGPIGADWDPLCRRKSLRLQSLAPNWVGSRFDAYLQGDAGPGSVAGVVTRFEHRVHLHRGSHQPVVAVLAQLLPGALPQLLVGDRRTQRGQRPHVRFVPGVPHFAKAPLAVRQRAAGAASTGGHFMNLPFASLHGAATDGAESPAAMMNKIINYCMILSS